MILRRALSRQFLLRTMSTSTAKKHLFVVYAPDMSDPGAFQRRMDVRPKHVDAVKSDTENIVRLGGAMLTPESIATSDAPKKLIGSIMFFESDSLETLRRRLESDIYYTSGVWDKEKLVVAPFAQAVGNPLVPQ